MDEAFRRSEDLVEAGLLGREFLDSVEKLNGIMDELQNSSDNVWSEDAVLQHPLWEDLRVCAQKVLERHELQPVPVQLDWITYVPGGKE